MNNLYNRPIEIIDNISYNIEKDSFFNNVSHPTFTRYLKTRFSNVERLNENFIQPFIQNLKMVEREDLLHQIDVLLFYFKSAKPFSYREAFELSNQQFRALVFGSINVTEMINNLGNTRIAVEGKKVTHKVYKQNGTFELKTYDVIYELYQIDCSELGLQIPNYCVKCWCTTTNKEHWLWVEKEYAEKGPLEAIASTVRVYENMIPFIKYIKRQGDVLLFEMSEKIIPHGKIIPLTAEKYFSKLIAQS